MPLGLYNAGASEVSPSVKSMGHTGMEITESHSFLSAFISDVSSGLLVPAAMQRPYQWEKSDVEALCVSIMSRFPIGGFLLWQPGLKADLKRLAKDRLGPVGGQFTVGGCARSPACLLLDGQHRLATLAWMLLQEAAPEADYSPAERRVFLGDEVLVLDHASASMKFVTPETRDNTLCLPAWTALGHIPANRSITPMKFMRRYMDENQHYGEDALDDMAELLDRTTRAFAGARVSATVIRDAAPEEAKKAFLLISKTGVPMSAEDFDRAVGWQA